MSVDYSKGRYKVMWGNGDLVGTINFERCVRLDGEIVYEFDEEGCLYDSKNELVGYVGDGEFTTLRRTFKYHIQSM